MYVDLLQSAAVQLTAVPLAISGLVFASAFVSTACQMIFDTGVFKRFLGKESPVAQYIEVRPYIALVVAVWVSFEFGLVAMHYAMGVDPATSGAREVDMVLTGIVVGSGARGFKFFVKRYRELKKITSQLKE